MAVGLILTGIFGFGITKLDFATDQDSYLNKDDQVYIDSVDYQDLFGGQAMFSVLRTDPGSDVVDLMSADNQEVFVAIATDIGGSPWRRTWPGLPNVEAIVTPLTAVELSDTLSEQTPDGQVVEDPTQSIAGGALAFAAGLSPDGPPELQEVPGTPEAEVRTADSNPDPRAAQRHPPGRSAPSATPSGSKFLLYDNQDESASRSAPSSPTPDGQMVTRLGGNLSIEDEGAAAEEVTRSSTTPRGPPSSTGVRARPPRARRSC